MDLNSALSGLSLGSVSTSSSQLRRYQPASLSAVEELGRFSTDERKRFLDDESQLRYLHTPRSFTGLNWDLNVGYADWIPYSPCHLDLLVDWIESSQGGRLPDAEFLSRRSVLTAFGLTPYCKDAWRMLIVRAKGRFFVTEVELEPRRNDPASYWGHKFEDYLCADASGDLHPEGRVNCCLSFRRVVRRRLGEHSVAIVGEVDAFDKERKEFVELKLCKEMSHPGQEVTYHKFKTPKWWLQSTLIGVARILQGNRTQDGVVRSLKEVSLDGIATEGRRRGFWDSQVCLNSVAAILNLIKATIRVDDPRQVWLLERTQNSSHISAPRKVSEKPFLPEAFLRKL